ncbi:MAG TPA: hypothetical protein VHI52_13610 [Verrucomicrobiae bacterium]|nr:hypothetical protein [Verrucomicrobiae bacterium]
MNSFQRLVYIAAGAIAVCCGCGKEQTSKLDPPNDAPARVVKSAGAELHQALCLLLTLLVTQVAYSLLDDLGSALKAAFGGMQGAIETRHNRRS